MNELKLSPFDEGCWLDNCRGRYLGEELQRIAQNAGWEGEYSSADEEEYDFAVQEAEDFMNTLAPEGYYFGYNFSGDWGLWRIEEDI